MASTLPTEAPQSGPTLRGTLVDVPTLEAEYSNFSQLQYLQTEEQRQLLDAIDTLRAHGVGEVTDLPQLVVCGDQSSGKSSVLEAISGVPFPRDATLCTRYATEVILRRSEENQISVSIVPSKDRELISQQQLRKFERTLEHQHQIAVVFGEAEDAIGLKIRPNAFSKDILRLEISGPNQPPLTIVDLPGLIQSLTKDQTEHDKMSMDQLVNDYISNRQSIILAVVSAKNDVANQAVLTRARQVDPEGERTLGIITKPDTLKKGRSSEAEYLALVKDKSKGFRLGWHVVKNLDSEDFSTQTQDRDKAERDFFQTSSFNSLPPSWLGIENLRKRLSTTLFNQIKTKLPCLVMDIQKKIESCQSERSKLGSGRGTLEQQRNYLQDHGNEFQDLCKAAIKGDYDNDFFYNGADLEERGMQWKIVETTEVFVAMHQRHRKEAIAEAVKLLRKNRGLELAGLSNPRLVGELFREYSRPWERLALVHIEDVWNVTRVFVDEALRHVFDETAADGLFRERLDEGLELLRQSARTKLDELIDVHRSHPMTSNPQFLNLIERSKAKRIDSDDTSSRSANEVAAEEALDNMLAYYNVAMAVFMDNVPSLAIRAPILQKLPDLFSAKVVREMPDDVVTRIASESEDRIEYRDRLDKMLATLSEGARICKQYATRAAPNARQNPMISQANVSQLNVPFRPNLTSSSLFVTPTANSKPTSFATASLQPGPGNGSTFSALSFSKPPTFAAFATPSATGLSRAQTPVNSFGSPQTATVGFSGNSHEFSGKAFGISKAVNKRGV